VRGPPITKREPEKKATHKVLGTAEEDATIKPPGLLSPNQLPIRLLILIKGDCHSYVDKG